MVNQSMYLKLNYSINVDLEYWLYFVLINGLWNLVFVDFMLYLFVLMLKDCLKISGIVLFLTIVSYDYVLTLCINRSVLLMLSW